MKKLLVSFVLMVSFTQLACAKHELRCSPGFKVSATGYGVIEASNGSCDRRVVTEYLCIKK